MSTLDIKVPDIGDFDAVAVIELMVKVGDHVKVDQSLITVESDKASMEIPSSHEGVITALKVKVGDKVKEGSVIATVTLSAGAAASASPSASSAPMAAAVAPTVAAATAQSSAPAAVQASASAPSEQAVVVPDIGDFKDVAVIELMVKEGDTVGVDQSLITVESDKASMEIPSSHAGVVKALKVKVGDKINKGDLLALVLSSAPAAAAAAASSAASAVAVSAAPAPAMRAQGSAPSAAPAHQPSDVTSLVKVPHASPSIRKFARELGVPLGEVKGTGFKGRITIEDVQSFSKGVMSGQVQTALQKASASSSGAGSGAGLGLLDWPKVDFTKFGAVERKPMGRIKKISGANLHRNWVMIPHVTNHDDADITELEAFRVLTNKEHEKSGVKVTMLAFLIKACVSALKKFPEFNTSLDGEELVYKHYFHIGFAADTPNGLMVPVIRDADKKGVMQISQEMSELAKKARDGKLSPAEMTGACFTISSLGGIGGRYFTPIINAPEVAILGVCKSQMQPVWDGKAFVPRLILPLSLSWDHRVIDGALAARFNAYLGQILADFRRVLL